MWKPVLAMCKAGCCLNIIEEHTSAQRATRGENEQWSLRLSSIQGGGLLRRLFEQQHLGDLARSWIPMDGGEGRPRAKQKGSRKMGG